MEEKETIKISDIQWELDDIDIDLPNEVELPSWVDSSNDIAVCDYLSDTYGFLVKGYSIPMTNDDVDYFGQYVNKVEGMVS